MTPPRAGPVNAVAPDEGLVRAIGLGSAILFVIGGVIGSGIFLTTGGMAAIIPSTPLLLLAWALGGLLAICGGLDVRRDGRDVPPVGRRVCVPEARLRAAARLPVRVGVAAGGHQRRGGGGGRRLCRISELLPPVGVEAARVAHGACAVGRGQPLGRAGCRGGLARDPRGGQLRRRPVRRRRERAADGGEGGRARRAAGAGARRDSGHARR